MKTVTGKRIAVFIMAAIMICIPGDAINEAATPTDLPVVVTVENGTPDKTEYQAGDIVTITATIPENQTFDKWVTEDNDVVFTDANNALTTFIMPAKSVTVKATFNEPPAPPSTYLVTVENGTSDKTEYEEGETVTITADAAPDKKVFDKWTTGDGFDFENANSASTTFIMPGKNVKVTAIYKDQEQPPQTGDGDTGSGNTGEGSPSSGSSNTGNGSSNTGNGSGNTSGGSPSSGSGNTGNGSGSTGNKSSGTGNESGSESESGEEASGPSDNNTGTTRAPGTNPDGTPRSGDTDPNNTNKSSSIKAQGGSFNILDSMEAIDKRAAAVKKSISDASASGPPAGASKTGYDVETGVNGATSGFNVVLVGVKENNTKTETWKLLMEKGIVFEGFQSGTDGATDTDAILQSGMEGVRKEEASDYWNSPAAATTALAMINQFGFHGIEESGQKESDAQVLSEAAGKLANEGLVMNAQNLPFFMEIQLTGNSGSRDSIADLLYELDADGLGGNTVLLFMLTGEQAGNSPLVMVHPAITESMTIKTPMRSEDILATILTLSGNANAYQYVVLNTMPGRNLLTASEFEGMNGLVPEPPKEEEKAEGEEKPEASAVGMPEGMKVGTPESMMKNWLNRQEGETTKVTTGIERPGDDVSENEVDLLGPAAEVYEEGPQHP